MLPKKWYLKKFNRAYINLYPRAWAYKIRVWLYVSLHLNLCPRTCMSVYGESNLQTVPLYVIRHTTSSINLEGPLKDYPLLGIMQDAFLDLESFCWSPVLPGWRLNGEMGLAQDFHNQGLSKDGQLLFDFFHNLHLPQLPQLRSLWCRSDSGLGFAKVFSNILYIQNPLGSISPWTTEPLLPPSISER